MEPSISDDAPASRATAVPSLPEYGPPASACGAAFVGVGLGVFVAVLVGVSVGVFVEVFVGVGVDVDVPVAVFVGVFVLVGEFVGVFVAVPVAVLVGVRVGVEVAVGVCVDVGVDVANELKVTVKAPFDPITTLQGLFDRVQPGEGLAVRLFWPLQPAKVEPAAATALNVTVAPLSEVVMFEAQVLFTVCEVAPDPEPPQLVGAVTVPVLTLMVTAPLPVPANVSCQFRASVKAPDSVTAELSPVATYAYDPIARSSSQRVT